MEKDPFEELQSCEDKPVVVINSRGEITYVNDLFESTFGWTLEEALGESITLVIPSELHDAHNMGFSRFISSGQGKILEQKLKLKAINKAGEVFDAEHFIVAAQENGSWQIAASMVPL